MTTGMPPAEGLRESPGENLWGKSSRAPTPPPRLLSPDLPLAEAGLPAEGWAVPRAQICTGLRVIVGTEQSWQAQELWLGTGWYTQAWVCPFSSPIPLPQPLLRK